LFNSN
jgi:hypothetical protein